ncbi:hypothetical protein ID866_3371 [Astraeus odoratus]|nr:hypothetical protein ID866_3371 [Astraeus odoratus]
MSHPGTQVLQATKLNPQYIGPLPVDLHVLILTYLSIPDVARYARVSRAARRAVSDERLWERRWADLGVDRFELGDVLDALESKARSARGKENGAPNAPATIAVSSLDDEDDFGDFKSASGPNLLDLTGDVVPLNNAGGPFGHQLTISTFRAKYARAHMSLIPLVPAPDATAHTILASIASFTTSLPSQGRTLHLLARFLSPSVKPLSSWELRLGLLKTALDRFDAGLLTAFDKADTEKDEKRMREAAAASWEVWVCLHLYRNKGGSRGEWEMGRVWVEKREVLYEQGKWDPLANITKDKRLDFTPMDAFMSHVLATLQEDGKVAARVFPPKAGVLLSYTERVAGEVVGEYISPLLSETRNLSTTLFLSAAAACFREAWRVVDGLLGLIAFVPSTGSRRKSARAEGIGAAKPEDREAVITREQAEDVIFKMFEPHMDDYLDDEVEELKRAFEIICKAWERSLPQLTGGEVASNSSTAGPRTPPSTQARFLDSQNPALAKRNVLASFTDVLLLPVTIVPRAVGAGVGALGNNVGSGLGGMVQGISMLHPQRWMGNAETITRSSSIGVSEEGGYKNFTDDGSVFEVGEDEDEENLDKTEDTGKTGKGLDDEAGWGEVATQHAAASGTDGASASHTSTTTGKSRPSVPPGTARPTVPKPAGITPSSSQSGQPQHARAFTALDLLLSLDVSLELIHATRDALKRLETFSGYPRPIGTRVCETLEEAFCEMLIALGTRHMTRGFGIATERMMSYKPAEHEETTSVAPLLQFFELVHIGDTIQSMVQVFFDKEMASHIDRTDFLNIVVREKKRFENSLDDCVAAGLNAGTQVLMNQVEHIIITRTKPREYYPPDDAPLELGPTVPNITAEFDHLKMLGHVFIVEDAKDLAQIVRDVTRYGGAYRPEDVYEFIQRRSDWKKIEKTVDKTMYNLSFKEDCIIC